MDVIKRLEIITELDRLYRERGTGISIVRAQKADDEELIEALRSARKIKRELTR
jgi:hypothetical protein